MLVMTRPLFVRSVEWMERIETGREGIESGSEGLVREPLEVSEGRGCADLCCSRRDGRTQRPGGGWHPGRRTQRAGEDEDDGEDEELVLHRRRVGEFKELELTP